MPKIIKMYLNLLKLYIVNRRPFFPDTVYIKDSALTSFYAIVIFCDSAC